MWIDDSIFPQINDKYNVGLACKGNRWRWAIDAMLTFIQYIYIFLISKQLVSRWQLSAFSIIIISTSNLD